MSLWGGLLSQVVCEWGSEEQRVWFRQGGVERSTPSDGRAFSNILKRREIGLIFILELRLSDFCESPGGVLRA